MVSCFTRSSFRLVTQKVRGALTENITLSYLSAHYELEKGSLAPPAFPLASSQKFAADLFEARIGALYVDLSAQGRRDVWDRLVFDIFSPEVFPDIEAFGQNTNAPVIHTTKQLLKSKKPLSKRAKAFVFHPFTIPGPPIPA